VKFSLKIAVILITFLFVVACSSLPASAIPQPSKQIATPTPKKTPTFTPRPTITSTPTFIPLPTKEVLLQYGVFGGDGGEYSDYYFGRDTPKLVLYTDGQLLIRKRDNNGTWFAETRLTTPQICSLLSQVERTGIFDVESDGSLGSDDPIYKFDSTAQFSVGGYDDIIQVNGSKHKQINIYSDYIPYLIPEVKQALNLFRNYSPPSKLIDYRPQYMLLWIEKGPGGSIYSTPAPIPQIWPANVPSLDILEKDKVETMIYLDGYYAKKVSQVLVEGKYVRPIFEIFGNRLTYKLFQNGDNEYYVIARPLLPHEALGDFSSYPEEKEFDLPFECAN
jgi:hypothetical protein